MIRPVCLLALSGALLVAYPESVPRQWAVVIGIDDYANFTDEDGGDLRGAEADALRVRHALIQDLGVPPSNILVLLGSDATRSNIESAFTSWLPERVRREDRLFVYFSGHGGQAFDESGDEADGLDETICPVDVLRTSTENDIVDDELNRWLIEIPARLTLVILDSCHSGTATRMGVGYQRSKRLPRSPPARTAEVDGDNLNLLGLPSVVELSASAPGQAALETAWESTGGREAEYGGVFTRVLLEKLGAASESANIEDLYWATFHAIKGDGYSQDPSLSGDAQHALFTVPAAPSLSSKEVRR